MCVSEAFHSPRKRMQVWHASFVSGNGYIESVLNSYIECILYIQRRRIKEYECGRPHSYVPHDVLYEERGSFQFMA